MPDESCWISDSTTNQSPDDLMIRQPKQKSSNLISSSSSSHSPTWISPDTACNRSVIFTRSNLKTSWSSTMRSISHSARSNSNKDEDTPDITAWEISSPSCEPIPSPGSESAWEDLPTDKTSHRMYWAISTQMNLLSYIANARPSTRWFHDFWNSRCSQSLTWLLGVWVTIPIFLFSMLFSFILHVIFNISIFLFSNFLTLSFLRLLLFLLL